MDLDKVGAAVAVGGFVAGGVSFAVGRITGKVKHENNQDHKVNIVIKEVESLKDNIQCLEDDVRILKDNNKSYEIALTSILKDIESLSEKHQTTQSMIADLSKSQNDFSMELIRTITELTKGAKN